MRWRFLLDWRRVLIYSHRWLGIAGCVLFVAWFASGIVMMYARMPSFGAAERLAMVPVVDLSNATVAPRDSIARFQLHPDRLRIGMSGSRPVYRFFSKGAWTTVFADSGDHLSGLTSGEALDLVSGLLQSSVASLRQETRMTTSDQWTLGGAMLAQMPIHRIAVEDGAGTVVYFSERTGEIAMKTTSRNRLWGYLGPVIHYLYFTPFRKRAELWSNTIIGLSFAGCLSCLSGIAIGVWRFSMSARFRRHGSHSRSPYMGLMLWHHYAGLLFGVASFTWIFSGGLSLDPFDWHSGTSPTKTQRDGFTGGPVRWNDLSLARVQEALATVRQHGFEPKELEVTQFLGMPYIVAYSAASPEYRLIPVRTPDRLVTGAFDEAAMLAAAQRAMPGIQIVEKTLLSEYDSYYYDRSRTRPLPVWKFRFADAGETWLYADARRGAIVQKQDRLTRWNRWLYHGLHSLDFPFLYYRRPYWDMVVIGLSIGGLVATLVVLSPAWTRIRRHAVQHGAVQKEK